MFINLVGSLAQSGRRIVSTGAGVGPRSFSTTFTGTENPLSEGGAWNHTTTTWQKPQKSGGFCFVGAQNDSYDDSYAYLSGFGPDYEIEATIRLAAGYVPTNSHEVELLLRVSEPDTLHLKAYECLYGMSGGSPYVQIMKWDGEMGADYFTPIDVGANPVSQQDGDKIRARIVGPNISFWHVRGATVTLMASATDSSHTTGQPGVSFFMRAGGTPASYSLTDYTVTEV